MSCVYIYMINYLLCPKLYLPFIGGLDVRAGESGVSLGASVTSSKCKKRE